MPCTEKKNNVLVLPKCLNQNKAIFSSDGSSQNVCQAYKNNLKKRRISNENIHVEHNYMNIPPPPSTRELRPCGQTIFTFLGKQTWNSFCC